MQWRVMVVMLLARLKYYLFHELCGNDAINLGEAGDDGLSDAVDSGGENGGGVGDLDNPASTSGYFTQNCLASGHLMSLQTAQQLLVCKKAPANVGAFFMLF